MQRRKVRAFGEKLSAISATFGRRLFSTKPNDPASSAADPLAEGIEGSFLAVSLAEFDGLGEDRSCQTWKRAAFGDRDVAAFRELIGCFAFHGRSGGSEAKRNRPRGWEVVIYVADACAVIALLRGEDGCEKIRELLLDPANQVRMHAVNFGEVYYLALRRKDADFERIRHDVISEGIQIRRDLDDDFVRLVGRWKSGHRLVYADAFVLGLAERDAATVISTDHGELDPIAAQGAIPFLWLR
jgi:PIN domain nuclease of toxin-antitoxin system